MTTLHRYHTNTGSSIAVIISEGTKWLHYVTLGTTPIRLRKTKLANKKYFRPVNTGVFPDSLNRILDVGTRLGITNGAKQAIEAKIAEQSVSDG